MPTPRIGLRPRFVILRRHSRGVAARLLSIGCVPERTEDGTLVLLGPTDPGAIRSDGWQHMSAYQLCNWYAREIARLGDDHEAWSPANGRNVIAVTFGALRDPRTVATPAAFLTGSPETGIDWRKVYPVPSRNRNPRSALAKSLRDLPSAEIRHSVGSEVGSHF